jgi:hypothetical protein
MELTPAIDIYESEKELLLVADLPSVTPEALTLEVNHPDLKIEGRIPGDGKNPERVYSRTFRLDSTLDVTKIEAKLSDGKPDQDRKGPRAGTKAKRKESLDAVANATRLGNRPCATIFGSLRGRRKRRKGTLPGGRSVRLGVDGKG